MNLSSINAYIEANQVCFVEELRGLVPQPSISTENKGVKECAQMICFMMEQVDTNQWSSNSVPPPPFAWS